MGTTKETILRAAKNANIDTTNKTLKQINSEIILAAKNLPENNPDPDARIIYKPPISPLRGAIIDLAVHQIFKEENEKRIERNRKRRESRRTKRLDDITNNNS